MKVLKSKKMKAMLRRGLRLAKSKATPSDGYFNSLIHEDAPNGWHYQVEYVNDSRFYKKPMVIVYAFKPPRTYHAKAATHVLEAPAR